MEIFDTDNTYSSIEDFLLKMQDCYNYTGDHTRVVFQVVFEEGLNSDFEAEMTKAIDQLEHQTNQYSDIFGYSGFLLEIDDYCFDPFKYKLRDVIKYATGRSYEKLSTIIECSYMQEDIEGDFLYKFHFNILLDAEDQYKPKACVFNVSLNCSREFEDSQWMYHHPIIYDLPENLLEIEQATFNQILKISKKYWIDVWHALLNNIDHQPKKMVAVAFKSRQGFLLSKFI